MCMSPKSLSHPSMYTLLISLTIVTSTTIGSNVEPLSLLNLSIQRNPRNGMPPPLDVLSGNSQNRCRFLRMVLFEGLLRKQHLMHVELALLGGEDMGGFFFLLLLFVCALFLFIGFDVFYDSVDSHYYW